MNDLKKVWIISGILTVINFFITFLYFAIDGISEIIFLFLYGGINLLFAIAILVMTIIVAKKSDINKILLGFIGLIGLILSILTPIASLLPLISYTAMTSEKKAAIWKWILGIILLIASLVVLVPFLLATIMLTDSGIPEGLKLIFWVLFLLLIYNAPVLTLYGVILGNKKSPWYYLMLAPLPQTLAGVIMFNIP